MQVKLLFSARALLAESPLWFPEEKKLYFLDIEGLRLHRLDPKTRYAESFPLSSKTGCIVPYRNGSFLIAAETGIKEIRIIGNKIKTVRNIVHPEKDKPENRYNDGKCSPDGRFFFGSINFSRKNEAALYVLDETGCRTAIRGATNSNGLGWSLNGKTFYWIDTPTRRVDAFDYDSLSGNLTNRRTVITFTPDPAWGRPDGMTVDAEGMIWIAHWLGWRITRWNPNTGQLLETISIPAARVTSLCFGCLDTEQLDTLFITTASFGLYESSAEERAAQPDAGGIFMCQPNIGKKTGGTSQPAK